MRGIKNLKQADLEEVVRAVQGIMQDSQISSVEWNAEKTVGSVESLCTGKNGLFKKSVLGALFEELSEIPDRPYLAICRELGKSRLWKSPLPPALFGMLRSFRHGLKSSLRFLRGKALFGSGRSLYYLDCLDSERPFAERLSWWLPGRVNVRRLDLIVNTGCNLNCRDCVAMIGQNRKDIPELTKDKVMETLADSLRAIDHVGMLHLLGGEPFLVPFLDEVIRSVPEGWYDSIALRTNGTVVPDNPALWEAIRERNVKIEISGYGLKQPLIEFLEENEIGYEIFDKFGWIDFGQVSEIPEGRKADRDQFRNCHLTCRVAFRSRLYYCSRSAFGEHFGFFENPEKDSADLKAADARKQVRRILKAGRPFRACDYCLRGTSMAKALKVKARH